jgi:hypothetical protein
MQNAVTDLLPLREVPTGGGNFGFVDALLISTEVWNLKRELKAILEHPHRVEDQLDQFLGPQIYTWMELMSILGIVFFWGGESYDQEGCPGCMGKTTSTRL